MKAYDEAAQEHIDRLQSALDAADIENEELQQTIKSLMVQLRQYQADREFCP